MTVCMAVICEEADNPKIIFCSDRKISSALGNSETMLKVRTLGHNWRCMVAGIDNDINAIVKALRLAFVHASEIDETNAVSLAREALNTRKRTKIEEIIQGKFAISYEEFLATGKDKFPPEVFRSVTSEVELIKIEAEFIIAGFPNDFPMIIQTDQNCRVSIKEDFAVIGEGGYLAQASLLQRGHTSVRSLGRVLYSTYEAKKFSEGAPSVGKDTVVSILFADGRFRHSTSKGEAFLDELHKQYERKHLTNNITVDKFDEYFVEVKPHYPKP